MGSRSVAVVHTLLVLAAVLTLSGTAAAPEAGPSRLSVDFSSNLIVSPDKAPASVTARLDAVLADMAQDGVNNPCQGRLAKHFCPSGDKAAASSSSCAPCLPLAATASHPCSCAGANNTRCTCAGQLTGAQFFSPLNYGIEIARALVVANNESATITGGINANFNTTVRLIRSRLYVNSPPGALAPGSSDLELDNSHLDLLDGSHLLLHDDSDLESEDASTIWIAGGSSLAAVNASVIETRLNHLLVEGGSSVNVTRASLWNVSQEYDMTPVQAAAVCNTPFKPDADGEYCFKNKEACKKRWPLLMPAQKQAVFMLQYPPALDEWGRQAFDYSDDVLYDDWYDEDYQEPALEAGACLGREVCGDDAATTATSSGSSGSGSSGGSGGSGGGSGSGAPAPPPIPQEPKNHRRSLLAERPARAAAAAAAAAGAPVAPKKAAGVAPAVTEVNPRDSADGKGYDPEFGEGPFGETLCDAPPFRSFNYYGLVVRGGSNVSITANSTWILYDQSRAFIQDSTLVLDQNATLHLMNSTLVLINSRLVVKQGSQILLQFSSGLHLFGSTVVGDAAMFAVPPNSTWQGQPWSPPGDFRASAGGSLPYYMGAKPGVQLGTYPMRVAGFGLEARLLPAAGCKCKKPLVGATRVAAGVTGYPSAADGLVSALAGLV